MSLILAALLGYLLGSVPYGLILTKAAGLGDIRAIGSGGERFDILSMGMSGDYEVAIECGANLVRVGSAIFGEPKPDAGEPNEDTDPRGAIRD